MVEVHQFMELRKYEVHNRGTRYIGYVTRTEENWFVMLVTGWTGNSGQWIRLEDFDDMSIAWSYLDEKMPAIGNHGGDKEGWVQLFAEIGIEVFG